MERGPLRWTQIGLVTTSARRGRPRQISWERRSRLALRASRLRLAAKVLMFNARLLRVTALFSPAQPVAGAPFRLDSPEERRLLDSSNRRRRRRRCDLSHNLAGFKP